MRQITIGNYKIVYPDNIIYLYDNNLITVEGPISDIEIFISSPDGEISVLRYKPKSPGISFVLDDNLKYLFNKSNGDWLISIYADNVSLFSFSTKVLPGKSFLNKSHGSSTVLYNYTGEDIEIFSPNGGKVICGNTTIDIAMGLNVISLSDLGITDFGEYQITLTNKTQYQPISLVLNDIAITPISSRIVWETIEEEPVVIEGGSLWDRKQIFPTLITLYYRPLCGNEVVLRYTNSDGCYREIAGVLLQEEDSFTPTKLNNVISSGSYKYNPHFLNSNNSKTLKIGFTDIDAGLELGDIIFSDKIQILDINNQWTNCMLKTDTIKNYKNSGFDDLELDIIISEV